MTSNLYYRLCVGLTDVGQLYPIEKSPYEIVKNLDQEVFRSVFLYTEEQYKEASRLVDVVNKNAGEIVKRPRGVGILTLADGSRLETLPGITNQLIFDFDCKDNLDKAKSDTIEVISRLKKWGIPESAIDTYYSGLKGFALKVYLNQFLTSSELHSICINLIDGLETADTVVYNDSRIVRLPYSKHGKSGLYCTPISLEELVNLKIDDIKAIAKNKYSPEEFTTRIDIPEELLKLKDLKPTEKKKTETKIVGASFEEMKDKISKLDFSKKMPLMSAAKWVLQQGFIPSGHGQEARMILAATYKAMGMDEGEAYYQLKATSQKRVKLLGKAYEFDKYELYNNVIATVYSDSWQGGTYSSEHPLLATIEQYIPSFLRSPKESQSNITTKDEAFAEFVDYSKEIDDNTILFGIPSLDRNLRILTKNVYSLLGSPGCLDENTFVPFEVRKKSGKRQSNKGGTIKRLYERFHGGDIPYIGGERRAKTMNSDYFITSMRDDGYFIKNKIVDVLYSGKKECFKLKTTKGLVIDATADHLFFTTDKYVRLGDLRVGDSVSVHLNTQKIGEGRKKQNRYKDISVKFHPKSSPHYTTCNNITYTYYRIRKNRAVYEAYLNNMSFDDYINVLNTKDPDYIKQNLILIPEGYDIHHLNEIHTDDRIENLIAIDSREHSKHHVRPENLMFHSTLDTIVSIESVGIRETYDIKCQTPYHNFVANKFVVHNSGKTTWLLQVLENTSTNDNKSIYFSFDMANSDTISKILTRHTGVSDEVIMENIKTNKAEDIEKYKKILSEKYKNVDFVFKPGLNIEDMENTIRLSDRMSGKQTKLIAVDYLSLIKSSAQEANAKAIEAIQGLRYLSHSLNIAVIVLLQPNKLNSNPSEAVTTYSAIKGSSEIAEACTAIMTMYREGYDPKTYENDNSCTILCVKNRKGKLFNLDFHWDGMRGLIREQTLTEKEQLKKYRADKEAKKAEEKANRNGGW
ncbi:MAG: DnaB-like helicase C-terminal domain-containing protein [Sphingobacteriaceae bacterium]